MECLSQVRALRRLLGELRDVVARLDVARANEVAAHLLRALGHAVLGWMLLRAASADREARSHGPRALMRFYFSQVFAESDYRIAVVRDIGKASCRERVCAYV